MEMAAETTNRESEDPKAKPTGQQFGSAHATCFLNSKSKVNIRNKLGIKPKVLGEDCDRS